MSIIKPDKLGTFSKEGGKLKIGSGGQSFHDRVNANKLNQDGTKTDETADMVLNRIGLMCDCSGSMAGKKEENLRLACQEFIKACDFSNTSVALRTFGKEEELKGSLSRDAGVLVTLTSQFQATGGTPMLACFRSTIEDVPITRGLIISDGQASDWYRSYEEMSKLLGDWSIHLPYYNAVVKRYVDAQIPVDCVHIGDSTAGEDLLQYIASVTGGIFIKFKNSGNFAQVFKYLAPTYRAMLGDGKVLLTMGADEVR